jgi:phosphoribosyl 1,2-cyclic phosphate phosphodiesterase
MTIAEALEMIVKLSPKKALLTHISHEVQLDAVTCKLPDHVSFAYDGLVINI